MTSVVLSRACCDLGVTTFLIRGFDPLSDAVGRELIPWSAPRSPAAIEIVRRPEP